MLINASVGQCSKTIDLRDECGSIKFRAQNDYERRFLSKLYVAAIHGTLEDLIMPPPPSPRRKRKAAAPEA